MSAAEDFLSEVERVVNGLAAELTAQKTILQHLLILMLISDPSRAQKMADRLKTEIMRTLKRSPDLADQAADKRVVELQLEHAERFFCELSSAIVGMNNTDEQKRH
jgi:hypothetical protein